MTIKPWILPPFFMAMVLFRPSLGAPALPEVGSLVSASAAESPESLAAPSLMPYAGVTFGTPAVLNYVIGQSLGRMGWRLSGAAYGQIQGWQGELLFGPAPSPNSRLGAHFALLGGAYHWQGTNTDGSSFNLDRKYWGLGGDMSAYGWFVEGNLNAMLLNGRNVDDLGWGGLLGFFQIGFQLGYLYQF